MKTIKIKFVDFPNGYDYRNSRIFQILDKCFEVSLSEHPDYLIYSVFGNEHLEYDCVKIFWTGENIVPDFNLCDYAIGFDYMDFGDRYLRCPLYIVALSCDFLLDKIRTKEEKPEENRKFCSFVYSNSGADEIRDELFYRISQYKKVDSAGKHLNNIKISERGDDWVEEKWNFDKNYKFSIACENCSHSGYTTEKIIGAFAAGAIPIYWGDPEIKKVFNEEAFIYAMDYDSLDDLVKAVQRIDTDRELYRKYWETPVFKEDDYIEKSLEDLEKFILHIFNQDYETCFRRSRIVWGKMYADRMRSMKRLMEHPVIRAVNKVKNIGIRIKRYLER